MEFNKAVSNPMLVGCIELMKAEDSPEHRNMFVEELAKSSFQAPAIIEPEPVADEEGNLKIEPGSRIQFPMLVAPDGKKFFMGFTDQKEYRKWVERNKEMPTFSLKIEDYANMILRRDAQGNEHPAVGVVVNPMGANVIIPKEMIAGMMAARAAQMRQRAGQSMPVVRPTQVPPTPPVPQAPPVPPMPQVPPVPQEK